MIIRRYMSSCTGTAAYTTTGRAGKGATSCLQSHNYRHFLTSQPPTVLQQRRQLQTTAISFSSNTTTTFTPTPLPYGLKRIDYSSLPPITNDSKPLYSLPPPPPHLYNPNNSIFKSTIQPMLAPVCTAILFASIIYLYLYPEEDVYEYWRQVEQGNVPVDGAYDDDDDDDDDSDEWDDE